MELDLKGLAAVTRSAQRGMNEVAEECRSREASAIRTHRVADAALYAEVADRAERVAARERELGYAQGRVAADEAAQERAAIERAARGRKVRRLVAAACVGLMLFAALLLVTGCGAMPPIAGPSAGTLEAYVGSSVPSGQGHQDVGDVGPYGIVGLSGSIAEGDALTGAAGEWWVEGGNASGEVDAGALGLFDLDVDVFRFGLGLRLGTLRYIGLDWGLGLGACITVVNGEASAGPALSRDISESGLGAYAAGTISRGPVFLRCTYIDGPSVDVQDEDVELGGLTVAGGVRWTF